MNYNGINMFRMEPIPEEIKLQTPDPKHTHYAISISGITGNKLGGSFFVGSRKEVSKWVHKINIDWLKIIWSSHHPQNKIFTGMFTADNYPIYINSLVSINGYFNQTFKIKRLYKKCFVGVDTKTNTIVYIKNLNLYIVRPAIMQGHKWIINYYDGCGNKLLNGSKVKKITNGAIGTLHIQNENQPNRNFTINLDDGEILNDESLAFWIKIK